MLHHYNYNNPLSQFLSFHQLEEQTSTENEQAVSKSLCEEQIDNRYSSSSNASSTNKSFTIAAILGLKGDNNDMQNTPTDLSAVVNLSVHPGAAERALVSNCSRLQLPIRHNSSTVNLTGQYSVASSCPRQTGLVFIFKNIGQLILKML